MTNQDKQYDELTLIELTLIKIRELIRADYARAQLSPALLKATSQLQIARLDYWESVFRSEICQPKQSWNPIYKLLSNNKQRVRLSWIDCCSGDGYQREDALRAIATGASNSFLFALILRRLNDWVPEVRAAARDLVPLVAKQTRAEYVCEAFWSLLPHLHTWGRIQREDKEILIDILSYEDIPLRLSEKIIAAPAGPAPTVLRQAGRQPAFDSFLPSIAERAVQPAVRAKAYQSQLDGCVTWIEGYQWIWTDKRWCKGRYMPIVGKREIQVARPFVEVLELAATDKSALVRRVAGNALLSETGDLGAGAWAIAQLLATDAYPSVSERGKFALKRFEN